MAKQYMPLFYDYLDAIEELTDAERGRLFTALLREVRMSQEGYIPSIYEVKKYGLERGNNVNAVDFVNYYELRDWKILGRELKDWKAAVRAWEEPCH